MYIYTVPESMSMERRVLLRALGAKLVVTPAAKGMKGAIAKANEMVQELGERGFMLQQFEVSVYPCRRICVSIWFKKEKRKKFWLAFSMYTKNGKECLYLRRTTRGYLRTILLLYIILESSLSAFFKNIYIKYCPLCYYYEKRGHFLLNNHPFLSPPFSIPALLFTPFCGPRTLITQRSTGEFGTKKNTSSTCSISDSSSSSSSSKWQVRCHILWYIHLSHSLSP